MREVKAAAEERWKMPALSQRFALGCTILEAPDERAVGKVLAVDPHSLREDFVFEVSCVRSDIPAEEQRRLDFELMLATALGDVESMAKALGEGASVDADKGFYPDFENTASAKCAELMAARKLPTPLMIAVAAKDEKAQSLLRSAGALEPEMRPRTSWMGRAFAKADLAEVVRHLARGASPNERLRQGEGIHDTTRGSPLHACCAYRQHRDAAAAVVALLCRLGADTRAPDAEGDTPLAHARYFRSEHCYAVLEAQGALVQGPYYSVMHVVGRRVFGWT